MIGGSGGGRHVRVPLEEAAEEWASCAAAADSGGPRSGGAINFRGGNDEDVDDDDDDGLFGTRASALHQSTCAMDAIGMLDDDDDLFTRRTRDVPLGIQRGSERDNDNVAAANRRSADRARELGRVAVAARCGRGTSAQLAVQMDDGAWDAQLYGQPRARRGFGDDRSGAAPARPPLLERAVVEAWVDTGGTADSLPSSEGTLVDVDEQHVCEHPMVVDTASNIGTNSMSSVRGARCGGGITNAGTSEVTVHGAVSDRAGGESWPKSVNAIDIDALE